MTDNKMHFEPYLWILHNGTRKVVCSYIKNTTLDYIKQNLPEKVENFKNNKGELVFKVNSSLLNFSLFMINEIAQVLKNNIEQNMSTDANVERENEDTNKFMERRMKTLHENNIIKFIDYYFIKFSNDKIYDDNVNKLVTFFNTHVNDDGDCSLFRGEDIKIFNSMILSLLSMIIHIMIARVKLDKDIKFMSIINSILFSECEKNNNNILKLMPLFNAFDKSYKNIKNELKKQS